MPPCPTQRADLGERLVIERRVELRFRQVRPERSADLHRANRPARGAAAAIVIENLAHRHAECLLDEPAALDVAAELNRQRAAGLAHAVVTVERAALAENDRDAGERDDVVDDRRPAEEALDGRQRRPGRTSPRLPSRLSSIDVSSPQMYAPAPSRTSRSNAFPLPRTLPPEISPLVCRGDRGAERTVRVRILDAQIDVPLRGADGHCRDGHPFDEREGVAFHQHAVGEGPGIALVGIAGDELPVGRRVEHCFPLDAGRERGAAAPAQTGVGHFLHDRRGPDRQRALQAS